jgi:hypothetical protein
MYAVIDLGTEVLLDRSTVTNPYVLLLASALGQTLAQGSPWVALDKQSASLCGLMRRDGQPLLAIALQS